MKRQFKQTIGLVVAIVVLSAQPLMYAVVFPAFLLNPWVLSIGGSLAGTLIFVGGQWVFKEASQGRKGTLEARAGLSTGTNTEEVIHWYDNKQIGRSTYNVSDERRFGQYDITVAKIAWDAEKGRFIAQQTDTYNGASFQTAFGAYTTSAKDSNGYSKAGYYLETGNTKKVRCDHWIHSSVSGDSSLAKHGNFSYQAKASYRISDMRYRGGGQWDYFPRKPNAISKSLSATHNDSKPVTFLSNNTRLDDSKVSGKSKLFWDKVGRWAPVSGYDRNGKVWTIQNGLRIKEWMVRQR